MPGCIALGRGRVHPYSTFFITDLLAWPLASPARPWHHSANEQCLGGHHALAGETLPHDRGDGGAGHAGAGAKAGRPSRSGSSCRSDRAVRPTSYARIIGQELSGALGQQFVVENKAGAGGVIGGDVVAKAAPDGYTLLMMSNTFTINETLQANKPYALLRDLVPVAPVNSSDLVMVVSPTVPAKTLAEFIALAKAEPGKLAYCLGRAGHALSSGRRIVQRR